MEKILKTDVRVKYHMVTLVAQIILMFNMMVVMKLFERDMLPVPLAVGIIIQLILLVIVHYLAFATVKFYLKSNVMIVGYGILVSSGFILLNIASPTNSRSLYIVSNILLLSAVVIWMYYIIKDIFKENHDLWYSIIAAANIYWLFIVCFGYCYSLMEAFFPGLLGIQTMNVMDIFYSSFRLSIHVMVGIDPPYSNIDEILGNFGLFQSATSNLYIIFMVGRLFSR